ncbi:AAA family ATPase [Priestia aryabhattai]|uniref:ATP-binding protein n=1 Tax=Priestia aryabhattai TaxID=412384 RepID=A0ABD7X2R3_PRIAR|nr:ATP-binding protein [Priestia aryabhattai]WEA46823.1 ATP-binding protein [Priestia aryabhattai]
MSHHIKTLAINSKLEFDYNLKTIDNLSKVNIFVGSNNSGKSRFLRGIFSLKGNLNFSPPKETVDIERYYRIMLEFMGSLNGILRNAQFIGINEITTEYLEKEIENFKREPIVKEGENLFKLFHRFMDEINTLNENSSVTQIGGVIGSSRETKNEVIDKFKNSFEHYESQISEINSPSSEEYTINFKRVYIPTLRGLRGYEDTIQDNKDIYTERTQNDYFKSPSDSLEIHTGLNLYDEITDMLLGSVQQRYNMVQFQKFLSKSFFEDQQVTITPMRYSDVIKVKIGTEAEKNIFDLGDGIQSLIILTFPLFKFLGENLLLFIEEPELYLHPGMQRKFIEIIMDQKFAHHQFFFTTHSNHFLDMTLDMDRISVYKFKKELGEHSGSAIEEVDATFSIDNVSNEDGSVLQELGVKNSAVLLSNCTIWVEGITDRFYIRRFLKVLQESHPNLEQFKEDIHYSFVEYSGGNITHWSFLDEGEIESDESHASMNAEKICSTLFLISDKDDEKKKPRQDKLKAVLGDRYYCLNCKEIENILSPDTIKGVIATYENGKLEHLKKPKFTQEDYRHKYLGGYIDEELLPEGTRKRPGKYSAKSKTITNKLEFCKRAIKHIDSYEKLSEDAKDLTKEIYNFIKLKNA